jgi:DNA replication initiation complex subunit (GINS family)
MIQELLYDRINSLKNDLEHAMSEKTKAESQVSRAKMRADKISDEIRSIFNEAREHGIVLEDRPATITGFAGLTNILQG